jgi:hypothetical protein
MSGHANTVRDHIDAFRRYSRHSVRTFNPVGMRDSIALDLDAFDAVVVHYSLVLSNPAYVSQGFRQKLHRYRGLKIQFMQDEYRWVDKATAASLDAGINVLFTCAPEPAASQLYDRRLPGVRRITTLTGYVSADLIQFERWPLSVRPLDVGYRGRSLPFWLGRLTQEKSWIAQGFLARSAKYDLKTDIAWREQDRIYGRCWTDFVSSCRATLGTESGASIADFDGRVEAAVRRHLASHRGASYEEVHDAVLRPYEGNVVVNVISPRVFEAAALGTALIMFPGTYSGIVAPGEHYIVLEKDFSNMDAVVEQLQDLALVSTMTERVHADLVASGRWSYPAFMKEFDQIVAEEVRPMRRTRGVGYEAAIVERLLRVPPLHIRAIRGAMKLAGMTYVVPADIDARTLVLTAWLAWRAANADPLARRIYDAGRKAGMPRTRLLRELLKLSLLRRGLSHDLDSVDSFSIVAEFEPAIRTLRFVSIPGGRNEASQRIAPEAFTPMGVSNIEWDHSAVGSSVRLGRPRVDIGFVAGGVERFRAISAMAKTDPAIIDEVITVART